MHPVICKIGPFTVYSYGLTLVAAFLTTSLLAAREAKIRDVSPDIIFNLGLIVFISGIIGSRVLYVMENLSYYVKNPSEILMLAHGGLSWFGGLVLAVISGTLYLKNKKLPIYEIFDLVAPFVALGQAIGRIGCLLNGCCFGRTVIPVQIYASLSLLLIFVILRLLQERPHKQGQIFFAYLIFYSLKRFFIEFWRLDNAVVFLGLTLFQLISTVIFCIAILKLLRLKRVLSQNEWK